MIQKKERKETLLIKTIYMHFYCDAKLNFGLSGVQMRQVSDYIGFIQNFLLQKEENFDGENMLMPKRGKKETDYGILKICVL